MRLYFMRHGPAGTHGDPAYPDDGERPLTAAGRHKTRQAARGMRALKPRIDAIISSPLVRAQQTAAIACDALGLDQRVLRLCVALAPGGSFEALIDELLKDQPDAGILLVGHEPDLSRTISRFLCDDADRLHVLMKKAALCELHVPTLPLKGPAQLICLLQPRQLRSLA